MVSLVKNSKLTEDIIDHIINEQEDKAIALFHDYLVSKCAEIHESFMQEDDMPEDDLTNGIEDDQHQIESEEYFGEDEEEKSEDEPSEDDMPEDDNLENAGLEEPEDDMSEEEVDFDELSDRMDDLESKLEKLIKLEEPEHGEDIDGDGKIDGEDEDEFDDESMDDSTDDNSEDNMFDDLDESFMLEPVKPTDLSGESEIGASGNKVKLNKVSPIPMKKPGDRTAAAGPVQIRSTEHKGFAMETPPETKKRPDLKNEVNNAFRPLKPVSKEGDSKAKLNSKEGFGSDSPKSVISGAQDTRKTTKPV